MRWSQNCDTDVQQHWIVVEQLGKVRLKIGWAQKPDTSFRTFATWRITNKYLQVGSLLPNEQCYTEGAEEHNPFCQQGFLISLAIA